MSLLDQLKTMTRVVADSSDFTLLSAYTPEDATTNPSLILKSCKDPKTAHLIHFACYFAKKNSKNPQEQLSLAFEKLLVNFAEEILVLIPGRVSIEIDARDSYDVKKSYEKAKRLIFLLKEAKIPKSRILIKLAATWEGILTAKLLENEKIHCNMTLIFSLTQALASAEANATLISPFVGRVLDWYQKKFPGKTFAPKDDPGVILFKEIFTTLKKHGYSTEILGASFRNIDQILELSGSDLLTLSLKLLEELSQSNRILERKLYSSKNTKTSRNKNLLIDEKTFKENLKQDAMASEKLSEGISLFSKDTEELEKILEEKLKSFPS